MDKAMSPGKPEDRKLNPAEYNRLVSHARVQSIRLINTRYDIRPVALSADRDDWKYEVSNRLLDWNCNNDSLLLSGTWEYTASCNLKRKQILKLVAKFLVTYRLSDRCDAEAGRQFIERVARFTAYPYFRGTFAMLTQQSGIALHPLPIISEPPRWVTPPKPDTKPKRKSVAKKLS